MNIEKDLSGKVAFVTGSARNLGRAFVLDFAERGANVVIHHHSDSSRAEAEDTLKKAKGFAGVDSFIVSGELSLTTIEKAFSQIQERWGGVDILVNNAGKIVKKPFLEISEQDFDQSFLVNTKAAFFCMQHAAKKMRNGGRIVNIATSILGATTGLYSVYAGSKAPLEDFSRALAKEIGTRNITVNTVAPGPLNTSFFYPSENESSVEYCKKQTPLQRLGEIQDIVPLVRFLTKEEARWMTGQTLFVNGGYVAR